jgi:hypothetical protein
MPGLEPGRKLNSKRWIWKHHLVGFSRYGQGESARLALKDDEDSAGG